MSLRKIHIMVAALLTLVLLTPANLSAQDDKAKIDAQKRTIAELEKKIKAEEQNIARLKNDAKAKQERIRSLSRQIASRKELLDANEQRQQQLQGELSRADSTVTAVSSRLETARTRYAEMVRESYRNYRNDNYLSYLLSASGLPDLARRIALLREVAAARAGSIAEIRTLEQSLVEQRDILARRSAALDSVRMSIRAESTKLQRDIDSAQSEVRKLNAREKQALRNKSDQEQKLSLARKELQRLTKGNKVGGSFTRNSKIDIPVAGGRIGRIIGDVCEIFGSRNAAVNSVYDGKVIAIRTSNGHKEVYIAHGERVTSYSNLADVSVSEGQTVKRNQRIGTIGSWVNPLKSEPEYKILFQIQSPSNNERYSLKSMFSK